MRTFVAMIRGINVAGHNKVRMGDLRALVAGLGYRDVTTYIQSGNVVLDSEEGSDARIARSITEGLADELGMDVTVVVRSSLELVQVLDRNPYATEGAATGDLHVTFLAEVPDPDLVAEIDPAYGAPHRFHVLGRDIYLDCPGGYGRSKLTNAHFEKKLRVASTTRNWRTVNKLAGLAQR